MRPVRDNATIYSLNSAGYRFFVLGIGTLSSHSQRVSIKPGELYLANFMRTLALPKEIGIGR